MTGITRNRAWCKATIAVLVAAIGAAILAMPARAAGPDDMTISTIELSLTTRGSVFGKLVIENMDGATPTVSILDGRGETYASLVSAETTERALSDAESDRLDALVGAIRGRPSFPSVFEGNMAPFGDGAEGYELTVQIAAQPRQDFRFRNFVVKPGSGDVDGDIVALTRALVEIGGFIEPPAKTDEAASEDSPFDATQQSLDNMFDRLNSNRP